MLGDSTPRVFTTSQACRESLAGMILFSPDKGSEIGTVHPNLELKGRGLERSGDLLKVTQREWPFNCRTHALN